MYVDGLLVGKSRPSSPARAVGLRARRSVGGAGGAADPAAAGAQSGTSAHGVHPAALLSGRDVSVGQRSVSGLHRRVATAGDVSAAARSDREGGRHRHHGPTADGVAGRSARPEQNEQLRQRDVRHRHSGFRHADQTLGSAVDHGRIAGQHARPVLLDDIDRLYRHGKSALPAGDSPARRCRYCQSGPISHRPSHVQMVTRQCIGRYRCHDHYSSRFGEQFDGREHGQRRCARLQTGRLDRNHRRLSGIARPMRTNAQDRRQWRRCGRQEDPVGRPGRPHHHTTSAHPAEHFSKLSHPHLPLGPERQSLSERRRHDLGRSRRCGQGRYSRCRRTARRSFSKTASPSRSA